jgi:hypothetical protein
MRWNKSENSLSVFLPVLALILTIVLATRHSFAQRLWLKEYSSTEQLILSLKERHPNHCDERAWENAVWRVWAGFSNGCQNRSQTTAGEIGLLRHDIQKLIDKSEFNAELLRRIWTRIGETNTAVNKFVKNNQVDFDEYVNMCRSN